MVYLSVPHHVAARAPKPYVAAHERVRKVTHGLQLLLERGQTPCCVHM